MMKMYTINSANILLGVVPSGAPKLMVLAVVVV